MGVLNWFFPKNEVKQIKTAEQAARRLLQLREHIAEQEAEMILLKNQLAIDYGIADMEGEPLILGNARVTMRENVSFNFGEGEKGEKKKEAFVRGLQKGFFHKMPHWTVIYREVEKIDQNECNPKIKALFEKYAPIIEKSKSVKVKHVHPSVNL